jgi:hypothetical protein
MSDVKPPRLTGDDRATLRALLQYQRESFVKKVSGVDETSARTAVVASGTTLLWLTQHMAQAEHTWIVRRFAGDDTPPPPEAETIPDAVDVYRQMWERADAIVTTSDLDALCADVGDASQVNLRWVLAHLLEETARHAGHADILRELVDGETGR